MAVAACTTEDKLPAAEHQALPNQGHFVAALKWAEPNIATAAEEQDAQIQ